MKLVRSIDAEFRLMFKKKGLNGYLFLIRVIATRCILRQVLLEILTMFMRPLFRENALPEKEELEADIDSDVATTLVDESSKSTFCMFVELYYCLSL
ncbi:transmembrane protein, putative [Medicago truncatula]|uniref:Transmembrane protein, putative n=1 Tax=Medicago truncatula TaxID=3880 RepID=G7JT23_MEDTR|nr:transmembrane protein, putative [Medicago truncatula]